MSIRSRLAVATAALAMTMVGLTLVAVYAWVDYRIERDASGVVSREIAEIAASIEGLGSEDREAELIRRGREPMQAERVYLFESHEQILFGNLPSWPDGLDRASPEGDLSWEDARGGLRVIRHARATTIRYEDGQRLLVGQDLTDQRELQQQLAGVAFSVFGLAVLLAIAGGVAIGRSLLQRVESMNQTILDILRGSRDERVPVGSRRDEFDELAVHFNRLLDDNQKLLAQMRGVTDDIAHDLRTPLARIRTRIESLLASPADEAASRDALHELFADTNGVLETFNALLRIAQIESGAIREQMEQVDLATVVDDAVELYQPVAEEAGVALVGRCEAGIQVRADRHLLAQALLNLIDNAIKYGGKHDTEGARVCVSATRSPAVVELCVADQGAGIPAADRERALQRFVRLDASRHRPGTGLGLSFVAAVVELHHGELLLEDNEPGLCVRLRFMNQSS